MGVEIVDVEWNDKAAALTVYIETEAGVDLDTCEKFHNAIMEPIDSLDPTYDKPYTLNVSSPGLDRPFKTKRDFERNLLKEILNNPIEEQIRPTFEYEVTDDEQ